MDNGFKLHRMFGLAQVEYHSWKNNWQDIGPDSRMTNICYSNAFPTALWQSSEAMWATVGNWWSRSRRRSSQLATGQCTHFAKRRTAHSTSSHRTQYITAPLSGRCTLTYFHPWSSLPSASESQPWRGLNVDSQTVSVLHNLDWNLSLHLTLSGEACHFQDISFWPIQIFLLEPKRVDLLSL